MVRRSIILGMLAATVLTIFPVHGQEGGQAASPPPAPAARSIPGIIVEDPYPNACVDCHIHYAEMNMDTRFSTLMGQWMEQVNPLLLAKAQASAPAGLHLTGRHPDVSALVAEIPSGCLTCHGKDAEMAPPFGKMMHAIHLTGGQENHFLTVFQGECTFCHKLDMQTGDWRIPSAPEH